MINTALNLTRAAGEAPAHQRGKESRRPRERQLHRRACAASGGARFHFVQQHCAQPPVAFLVEQGDGGGGRRHNHRAGPLLERTAFRQPRTQLRKGPGGVSRTSSSSWHSLWEYLDKFYDFNSTLTVGVFFSVANLSRRGWRIHVRERDLFGHWASRWRVIRTSNAYVFRYPQPRPEGAPASKSKIIAEHRIKKLSILLWHQHAVPTAPWSRS